MRKKWREGRYFRKGERGKKEGEEEVSGGSEMRRVKTRETYMKLW